MIGSPMLDGELFNESRVQVALTMMNRHGLIAGATGTGKTKTLQLITEQLSAQGVPVFVADVKGDVSGRLWVLAMEARALRDIVAEGDIAVVGDLPASQLAAIELGVDHEELQMLPLGRLGQPSGNRQ